VGEGPEEGVASLSVRAQILPFTETDLPALESLQPTDWRDIRPSFRFYIDSRYTMPVKAIAGNEIVGVGAAIEMGRSGWIGHVIVHPDRRGRGIGTTVVEFLVEHLREAHHDTISLVATDAGISLYKRIGFEPQAEYVFFERKPAGRPTDSRSVVASPKLEPADDIRRIVEIDREISGEDRSDLFRDHVDRTFVLRGDRPIRGYYTPGLGEGLIGSLDRPTGVKLLEAHSRHASRIALPAANEEGVRFLAKAGYLEMRRSTRMVLGTPFAWRPDCIYSRIGGHLG
jgi:ribosomal protein S18 acetylase RimI-like enzyme